MSLTFADLTVAEKDRVINKYLALANFCQAIDDLYELTSEAFERNWSPESYEKMYNVNRTVYHHSMIRLKSYIEGFSICPSCRGKAGVLTCINRCKLGYVYNTYENSRSKESAGQETRESGS